jgi:serine/threonine-protein kinase
MTAADVFQAALADRYTIARELGSGGMATVYLAEDVRHRRNVAIKVLHAELSAVLGPERFLKEIEVTANLQHPHILPLFDSGNAGGLLFYVMPFVDGETLRSRLERERQLPVSDALRIAREVADALAYAHARGVVHRDIKPENILLHQSHALVADFGIALAVEQAAGHRMTQTGLSLGTPQYMAPEQAMGERHIDARADIYALGAVTYEMLAGEPPFTGPTAQAIVARVLTERPRRLRALRETVSPAVEEAIDTALAKLPADRFTNASDFAAAVSSPATTATRPSGMLARTTTWRVAVAAVAAMLLFGAGWLVRGFSGSPTLSTPTRRAVFPLSSEFDVRGADVTVSADGRTIALNDGRNVVARRIDRLDLIQVPNASSGSAPFLSEDGTRIGFIRGRDLIVERFDGAGMTTLSTEGVSGGAFLSEDRIVITDTAGLSILRLSRSERTLVARAPAGFRFIQPSVLPGGKVIVTAAHDDLSASRVLVVDVERRQVDTLPVGAALRGQYADGWLYFVRPAGQVDAVRFDARSASVRGDVVSTGEQAVVARAGQGEFAAGSRLLVLGGRARAILVALSPDGKRTVLYDQPGTYHNPRVSPDGRLILIDRDRGGPDGRDVWTLDIASHALARLTTVGDAHDAVWMPDGKHFTYLSFKTKGGPIVTASVDGGEPWRLIGVPNANNPGQWLPDGSAYVGGVVNALNSGDIELISPSGARTPLVSSRFDNHSPAISPDGKWLAYVSDETGATQVYVRPLRGGGRELASQEAAEEPVWTRDGRLLFIERHEGVPRIVAVRFGAGTDPRIVARSVLIERVRYEPVGNHTNWDVMPDGRMVLVEPQMETQLTMVFDWSPPIEPRK